MRMQATLIPFALLALTLGCNAGTQPTPEQIRHDTAATTSTVVADVKGAAEGLKEGLHQAVPVDHQDAININTASRPNLEVLPGINPRLATQIIAHRPYIAPNDLRTKHVLTQSQYDAISSRITVN